MINVIRMASGGHRIQGEYYHNQDVHLTVACLRARKSQLSPRDAYYLQVQPERCQLRPLDGKLHGMPKYSAPSKYSNKFNSAHVRCSIPEDKRELRRILQQIQRHEAEAEVGRQKRVEQWRQLVVEEEREEQERKREIEKLQRMIDSEMQRAHHRYHTDVNSAQSSTHIPNNHANSTKGPLDSSAMNGHSNLEVEADNAKQTSPSSIPTDVDIAPPDDTSTIEKVKLAITIEEKDVDLPLTCRDQMVTDASQEPRIKVQTDQSSITVAETDNHNDITTAETDCPDDIATVEIDSPDDIITAQTYSPDNITTAETDCPDDIATVEIDSPDDIITAQTDSPDNITTAETDCPDGIAAVKRDSSDDITTAERDSPDDITTVDIDSHGVIATVYTDSPENITTVETDKSDATLTVQIATEPQIQTPDVTVTIQPEANEESRATPTVQIITDSDTRSESHDTQFWYHLNNTDDIYRTPESMSRVFTSRHSDYSCEILYLLLYS